MIDVPAERVKSMPALLGEADLVKTLQQLPGVAVGTEGMTGLYVRGGGADENLYLLDGNPALSCVSRRSSGCDKEYQFYKGELSGQAAEELSSR